MQRTAEAAQLFTALAIAQGEIESATKDAHNPHFGKSYADLASVREVCRLPLSKNGLCIIQSPTVDGVTVNIETVLAHKSGEWISNDLKMVAAGNTPQALGSAMTYGRRYALMAILGIAPEDDDGNLASGRPVNPPPAAQQNAKPPPKPAPVAGKPAPKPAPQAAPAPAAAGGGSKGEAAAVTTQPANTTTAAPAAAAPATTDAEFNLEVQLAKKILDAKTPADLDALVPQFKGLTDAQRAPLRTAYVARLKELNGATA